MQLPCPEPELSDEAVRLRKWSRDDVECIRLAATDADIPRGTTVPRVFSEEAAFSFIERQWGRQTNSEGISLAIAKRQDNEAVGLVTLLQREQQSVFGLGYWLIPPARGLGMASRAVELISRWALTHCNVTRVEAHVHPGNVASEKTLLTAGFQREGVLRNLLSDGQRPIDATVFSRIPEDLAKSATP